MMDVRRLPLRPPTGPRAGRQAGQGGGPRVPGAAVGQPRQGHVRRPDRFDIERPVKPLHVGFGRGVHACLGAQLARIEAWVALPMILGWLGDNQVSGEVDLAAEHRVPGRDRAEDQL